MMVSPLRDELNSLPQYIPDDRRRTSPPKVERQTSCRSMAISFHLSRPVFQKPSDATKDIGSFGTRYDRAAARNTLPLNEFVNWERCTTRFFASKNPIF